MTEFMVWKWILYCGAITGFVGGFAIGPTMSKDEGYGPWYSGLCGVAAMGLAGIVAGLLGLYLGATVHLTDVADEPGIFRALITGFMGFLFGGIAGIVPSVVGGFVGGLAQMLRKPKQW